VATDFALAAFWLVPRLAGFRALYPDTEVRVITAQHQITPDQADIDIAINFGDGSEAPGRSCQLFGERVVPVCSPALRHSRAGPFILWLPPDPATGAQAVADRAAFRRLACRTKPVGQPLKARATQARLKCGRAPDRGSR
jgi:DNA-binding transcriptional LysR family regulator